MSTRTMFATAAVAIGSSVTLLFGGVTGVANAEPAHPHHCRSTGCRLPA